MCVIPTVLRLALIPVVLGLVPASLSNACQVAGATPTVGAQDPDDDLGPPPIPIVPQPQVVVTEHEFHWDRVIQGAVVSHAFEIRNPGDAPLQLLKVTSNCGCTSSFFTKEIAPGEAGRVELQIDTIQISGGYQRKTATVFTNDPATPQLTLWMVGDVAPLLQSPDPILKVSGVCEESKEGHFRFTPGTDQMTTVVAARLRSGLLEVVALHPIEGGGTEVHLRAGPGESPALLRDELLLSVKTSENEPAEVSYPVVIEHLDRIRITPGGSVVFFRRQTAHLETNPARDVSKEIHLRAVREDLPFHVTGVRMEDSPEGLFRTEVRAVVPGQHYVVSVRVLRTMAKSQEQGRLVIEIDDPIRPTREREVFAQFRLRDPAG